MSAFWSEYIRHADDEIGRLMHRDAGPDLSARLAEVMEPVRHGLYFPSLPPSLGPSER